MNRNQEQHMLALAREQGEEQYQAALYQYRARKDKAMRVLRREEAAAALLANTPVKKVKKAKVIKEEE